MRQSDWLNVASGDCPPPEECDPRHDPDCEQPLKKKDEDAIFDAFHAYQRISFTDPEAEQECMEMAHKFQSLFAAGKVFRGNTSSVGDHKHSGAFDPNTGNIHFDPDYLDDPSRRTAAGLKDLLNTALHEAAHALGKNHGPGVESPWGMRYSDPYFHRLSPGANSCITY